MLHCLARSWPSQIAEYCHYLRTVKLVRPGNATQALKESATEQNPKIVAQLQVLHNQPVNQVECMGGTLEI